MQKTDIATILTKIEKATSKEIATIAAAARKAPTTKGAIRILLITNEYVARCKKTLDVVRRAKGHFGKGEPANFTISILDVRTELGRFSEIDGWLRFASTMKQYLNQIEKL